MRSQGEAPRRRLLSQRAGRGGVREKVAVGTFEQADGTAKLCNHPRKQKSVGFLNKFNHILTIWTNMPSSRYLLFRTEKHVGVKTCWWLFVDSVFLIAINWNNPIVFGWVTQTMEFYSAGKGAICRYTSWRGRNSKMSCEMKETSPQRLPVAWMRTFTQHSGKGKTRGRKAEQWTPRACGVGLDSTEATQECGWVRELFCDLIVEVLTLPCMHLQTQNCILNKQQDYCLQI